MGDFFIFYFEFLNELRVEKNFPALFLFVTWSLSYVFFLCRFSLSLYWFSLALDLKRTTNEVVLFSFDNKILIRESILELLLLLLVSFIISLLLVAYKISIPLMILLLIVFMARRQNLK